MAEIEKSIESFNGSRVSYKVSLAKANNENKLAVILIHGLASNMTRWTEFVNNTTISDSVDVLRLDLKGHGKSMSYSRITMNVWCEDLYQILIAEQYSTIILVGHSLGAQIAMHFAVLYPEKTKGLLLIDPVFPKALKGTLGIIRRLRYGLLFLVYTLLIKAKLGFGKKQLPYRDLHELDLKTREILNGQSERNIAELYMNPFEDLIYIPLVNFCQDMFEVTRKIPSLDKIKCSVLCLLSKGATVTNMSLTKFYVNQIPRSEIEVIDADHWLLTEKPLESRQAIDKWCIKTINESVS